jgi:hypothetical protein
VTHPGDFSICAECGEPRYRHRAGAVHKFAETDLRHEADRQFIARLKRLDLIVLEGMLSLVAEEWKWIAVQRQIDRRREMRGGK